MSNTVIKIENLSKIYRLGEVGTGTLSHDLNRFWRMNVLGQEDPYSKIGTTNDRTQKALRGEHVAALRDINLEVKEGEVLGIIGRNGAGKSTLLKILSRVTSPTTGSVKVKGRLASLLEVGTGFHPEMTGRENIYMNGTVMGMRRWEIDRKLDEIVEFAGVAKYLDTPTKRYSSGMTVRLGFAIAAHLEPEILVVDEVLAVGDAEFQKKAIGKMQDVSTNQGRTVLFVSHNMAAVKELCGTGIIFNEGTISYKGDVEEVIETYLKFNSSSTLQTLWVRNCDSTSNIFIDKVELSVDSNFILTNDIDIPIDIYYTLRESYPDKRIVCTIINEIGVELFYTTDFYSEKDNRQTGSFISRFVIPKRVLNKGVYTIRVRIDIPKLRVLVESNDYISFCIEETTFNQMGVFAHNEPKGLFHLDINWKSDNR